MSPRVLFYEEYSISHWLLQISKQGKVRKYEGNYFFGKKISLVWLKFITFGTLSDFELFSVFDHYQCYLCILKSTMLIDLHLTVKRRKYINKIELDIFFFNRHAVTFKVKPCVGIQKVWTNIMGNCGYHNKNTIFIRQIGHWNHRNNKNKNTTADVCHSSGTDQL